MNKRRIYMYPMKPHEELQAKNPYLFNLSSSLKQYFTIVNYNRPPGNSVKDLTSFFFRTDIFYFNWIENTASRQSLLFFTIFLRIAKAFRKQVIWTHHNIHPHNANSNMGKKLINLFSKKADFVVTHTKLSADILRISALDKRLLYFFHPFFSEPVINLINTKKKYDLLIWGNMRKSKGIDDFMAYLVNNRLLEKYNIKIIGKFESQAYFNEFKKSYHSDKIDIENRYADTDELIRLHHDSKFVFFPYTGSSVLNSGALITSLPYGASIIGPMNGAFTEVGESGLINLYSNFGDVTDYIENFSPTTVQNSVLLEKFFTAHTWNKFAEFIYNKIS